MKNRPGHDLRYAINSKKLETELAWKSKYSFDTGIEDTINWYCENKSWWKSIMIDKKIKGEETI